MITWTKGKDYYKNTDSFMTYSINKDDHQEAIRVYSSQEDRDLILTFLQEQAEKELPWNKEYAMWQRFCEDYRLNDEIVRENYAVLDSTRTAYSWFKSGFLRGILTNED